MAIDWETAYDNRRAVPGAAALQARWEARAEAFRERLAPRAARIATGPGTRDRVELFLPEGTPEGLAVFVHGGYWMRNAPEGVSHFAGGALARGWAAALPAYPLCPDVRIPEITAAVATGIAAAAGQVAGPIRIAGHSAGGHLALRMITPGGLGADALARVAGVLSISGLHDLRPLMRTPMNATLALDPATARAESPALVEPAIPVPVTAWVGAGELRELVRQSRLLATIWGGLGQETRLVEAAGQDHFTVVEGLADPDSPLTAAWLGG